MYNYDTEKPKLFTEEMQPVFLRIRDNVRKLCKEAGCCTMENAIKGELGDSWELMACVDRLVELKEIREVVQLNYAGQYRTFIINK